MTMMLQDVFALNVVPDKEMVPTLSHKASEFIFKRDMTRCFPPADRHVISIETPDGQASAETALTRLKIRKELKNLEFSTLWRSYDVASKMSNSSDNPEMEKQNIVRAYNYILRHLKEMRQTECETARVARECAYQQRMNEFTIRGEAPGMEDPKDPIVPTIPVMLQGSRGLEVPVCTLVHAAKLKHISSIILALLGPVDPCTGVDGTDLLSEEDAEIVKNNRLLAREIFESIAGANSPAGKLTEIMQESFFLDYRSRITEITRDMGWITRTFLQRVTNAVDACRLYAADFDQDRAKCPKMSLVEKTVWLFHFGKALGQTQEVGAMWVVELAFAHGPIAEQLGIKPVLTDEQHRTLCRMILESDARNSGKTSECDTPVMRQEEVMGNGPQVFLLGGSESNNYLDGNRRKKVDTGKTVWDLRESARVCQFPELWTGHVYTRAGGGAKYWSESLKSAVAREIRMGNAVQLEPAPPPEPSDATHSGGGTGGRNLCGEVQFKRDVIVVIRDAGNDANRLGRDDQRFHTHYMGGQRLADEPAALDETAHDSAEAEAHFQNTIVTALHVARAVVYVAEINSDIYGPHPPAQDHMRRTRIQFCHEIGMKYYGRILVVDGKGIVLHMDSLATNKRDRHEWHQSLEQEELCRNCLLGLDLASQPRGSASLAE